MYPPGTSGGGTCAEVMSLLTRLSARRELGRARGGVRGKLGGQARLKSDQIHQKQRAPANWEKRGNQKTAVGDREGTWGELCQKKKETYIMRQGFTSKSKRVSQRGRASANLRGKNSKRKREGNKRARRSVPGKLTKQKKKTDFQGKNAGEGHYVRTPARKGA